MDLAGTERTDGEVDIPGGIWSDREHTMCWHEKILTNYPDLNRKPLLGKVLFAEEIFLGIPII